MIDFREETRELGIQPVHLPHRWDDGAGKWRDERIDDMELAQDMALAADPIMERVIEQREFLATLQENPDDTYRRAGKKAVIFSQLVREQKAIYDAKREHRFGYTPESSADDYVRNELSRYVCIQSGGDPLRYYSLVPKSSARITNGFVAEFAEKAMERTERAADKAAELVYYKQKNRENISVYEQHLSERDQEVFRPVESPEIDEQVENWLEGDEEAIALHRRSNQLWSIYQRKRIVEMIAETFGRSTTRGFTRSDFEQLGEIVGEGYYMLSR